MMVVYCFPSKFWDAVNQSSKDPPELTFVSFSCHSPAHTPPPTVSWAQEFWCAGVSLQPEYLSGSVLSHLHHLPGSAFSSSRKCWPFPSLAPHCNLLFISEPLWDYCVGLFLCFSLSAWIPSTQMCPAHHLLSLLLAQGHVAFQKCVYQFNLLLLGHEKAGIILKNLSYIDG